MDFFLYVGHKNFRSQIKSSISRNNVTEKAAGGEGQKNWNSRGNASTSTQVLTLHGVLGSNLCCIAIHKTFVPHGVILIIGWVLSLFSYTIFIVVLTIFINKGGCGIVQFQVRYFNCFFSFYGKMFYRTTIFKSCCCFWNGYAELCYMASPMNCDWLLLI